MFYLFPRCYLFPHSGEQKKSACDSQENAWLYGDSIYFRAYDWIDSHVRLIKALNSETWHRTPRTVRPLSYSRARVEQFYRRADYLDPPRFLAACLTPSTLTFPVSVRIVSSLALGENCGMGVGRFLFNVSPRFCWIWPAFGGVWSRWRPSNPGSSILITFLMLAHGLLSGVRCRTTHFA
jgi:hypothetical protein